MKYKLRVISILMVICLLSSTPAFAEVISNFEKSNEYDSSTYYDVYENDWYYYYVGFAHEYGIMTGTDKNVFNPIGNITLAEAITVACRLNAKYYGNVIETSNLSGSVSVLDNNTEYAYPVTGDANLQVSDDDEFVLDKPKTKSYIRSSGLGAVNGNMSWFMPYMSYAVEQGIISPNQFSSRYSSNASREQLAYLLYKALPECYYKINDISPIPDVDVSNPYYSEILKLYEAGIVTGNDEYGTFRPSSAIVRSEVAAMVARVVDTGLRVSFTLNTNKPYKFLSYSWTYPYRGQAFSLDLEISYFDYNYFVSKTRTGDYASYADDDADVTGLTYLAETLRDMAIDSGFTSSYDVAGFVSAFVQSLEYQDDMKYKGVIEYPKYPIETLFDQGGDCEDSAVLLAKLLKILGYGAVLLVSDDHMAVGLQAASNGNLSFGGIEYYYIETTESGWRVGEVPNDLVGVGMAILYI